MTLVILCGAMLGLGVLVVAAQVRPAPPHLKSALSRLYPEPDSGRPVQEANGPDLKMRLGAWLSHQPFVTERIALPRKELGLLRISPSSFYGEKLLYALIGLMFPTVMAFALGVAGISLPLAIPALAAPAMAIGLSFIPDIEARKNAQEARQEFTRDIGAYLDLVALERKGGAGASKALESAARGGDNWVFQRLQEELAKARWSHTPAWDALSDLADELDVSALHDVADIMRMSGEESTGVYDTLRARSTSLRNAILSDEQARANADNERMVIPVTGLAMIFIALLAIPAVMQIA